MELKLLPLSDSEIIKKCEEFKKGFKHEHEFPYDLDLLIEKELGFDPIPSNYIRKLGIDALLLYKPKQVLYDPSVYPPDRIRFSLAHEIGHFVLHKEVLETVHFEDEVAYFGFMDSIPKYIFNDYEQQADSFAAHLLMPNNKVVNAVSKLPLEDIVLKLKNEYNYYTPDFNLMANYLAIGLAKEFEVTELAMAIKLKKLNKTYKFLSGQQKLF